MKLFYLFLLVIFINKPAAGDPSTIVKYHGGIRYWTIIDLDGRTYVSLNALKEAVSGPVKLLFPKEKNIAEILQDLTLFSPTNNEDACKTDNSKLEFKLKFDNENWIRGEVIVEYNIVTAYLYPKCPRSDGTRYYATNPIDENEANFVYRGRLCFQQEDLFQSYGATNKNVMELQVSESFKCKVFLIMPDYMVVEDEVLKDDIREPLNSTFAVQGEDFWWKSGNNKSLSDGISFVGRDAVINISQSTKSLPYYLRIGNNQPYPSLQFNFDPTCLNQQFELYVNLRDNVDCRIAVKLGENGLQITTKGGVSPVIQNGTKSLTMIFARGQSKVYVKAGLFIIQMEVCQIENMPDVPADQFVLQIAPSDTSSICNFAQVILPANDVKNKIEVLVDGVKAAKLIPVINEPDNSNSSTSVALLNSTYATAGETTDVATGALQWWWIVVPILIVGVIVAAVILICYCIRRLRKQSSKTKSPQVKTTNDQNGENVHPAPKIETAISVEQPPPPKDTKSKMNKKMPKKDPKEQEIGESKKSEKRSVKEKKNHYEQLPTNPPTQGPPPTISATQEDPTLETAPTQNSSNPANSIVQTSTKKQITSEYINFGK